MKTKILLFATAIFLSIPAGLFSQPSISLNFQGLLRDGDGTAISNESCALIVKFMNPESGKTDIMKEEKDISTDEEGWISFDIPDITPYLSKDGKVDQSLVIRLEFLPNSGTTWLKKGEDLMLTYTLTPTYKNEAIYLKMTRMEGSDLITHLDENLYVFKDEYPFANLTGGFLLTDAPPLQENTIYDLRAWMQPELNKENTRGVKGGFPKGGYRKRL